MGIWAICIHRHNVEYTNWVEMGINLWAIGYLPTYTADTIRIHNDKWKWGDLGNTCPHTGIHEVEMGVYSFRYCIPADTSSYTDTIEAWYTDLYVDYMGTCGAIFTHWKSIQGLIQLNDQVEMCSKLLATITAVMIVLYHTRYPQIIIGNTQWRLGLSTCPQCSHSCSLSYSFRDLYWSFSDTCPHQPSKIDIPVGNSGKHYKPIQHWCKQCMAPV